MLSPFFRDFLVPAFLSQHTVLRADGVCLFQRTLSHRTMWGPCGSETRVPRTQEEWRGFGIS